MDFQPGNTIMITDKCSLHKKICTIKYKTIHIDTRRRIKLEKVDTECEFLGTHYCSSIEEPMYEPYLTIFRGIYALESEDGETELSNLDKVKKMTNVHNA
jgi:hypothetical protein